MAALVQRSAIAASCQRLTLRQTRRMVPIMFSMMLVQASRPLPLGRVFPVPRVAPGYLTGRDAGYRSCGLTIEQCGSQSLLEREMQLDLTDEEAAAPS